MNGRRLTFGITGLLYNRNLLLYDHQTDSLWSQLLGRAVTGAMAGAPLRLLPAVHTTWADWRQRFPGTLALSFETGFKRDYSRDPYSEFPLDRSPALVVTWNGQIRIYPFAELKKAGPLVTDEIAGKRIRIEFQARSQRAAVYGDDHATVPSFVAFVADARAFYPDARIFSHKTARSAPGDR